MFAVVSINEVSGGEKSINFKLNPGLSSLHSYKAVPIMSHMTVFVHVYNMKKQNFQEKTQ